MGLMNTWYRWSRKYNEFLLKYNYGLLSGIFILLYMKFTTDISWLLATALGIIVGVVTHLSIMYAVWINTKGEEYTAEPVKLEEIPQKKNTGVLVELAKQINKGVNKEIILMEAEKRGISRVRMNIAIAYQQHPIIMILATFLISALITFLFLL